jgi:hypothetical protein
MLDAGGDAEIADGAVSLDASGADASAADASHDASSVDAQGPSFVVFDAASPPPSGTITHFTPGSDGGCHAAGVATARNVTNVGALIAAALIAVAASVRRARRTRVR